MNLPIVTNVKQCARCKNDHDNLEFKLFVSNPVLDCNDTEWNYWTLCPNTNEPILLRAIIVEENKIK